MPRITLCCGYLSQVNNQYYSYPCLRKQRTQESHAQKPPLHPVSTRSRPPARRYRQPQSAMSICRATSSTQNSNRSAFMNNAGFMQANAATPLPLYLRYLRCPSQVVYIERHMDIFPLIIMKLFFEIEQILCKNVKNIDFHSCATYKAFHRLDESGWFALIRHRYSCTHFNTTYIGGSIK